MASRTAVGEGSDPDHHDIVVIGTGQAGLATTYHLQEHEADFQVVAAEERVGDTWRSRCGSASSPRPWSAV